MKLRRKHLLSKALVLALMVVSLTACSEKKQTGVTEETKSTETASTEATTDTTTESTTDTTTGSDISGKVVMVTNGVEYPEVTEKFKKDYPNIELVWEQQAGGNVADVYKTRLSAGAEGIDVFTPSRSDYPVLASAGQLMDITGQEYLNNYMPGIIDSVTTDGKVYGVPTSANCYMVWYNKDMFDKYGLTAPTTSEELEKTCETLKQNGEVPFVVFGKADNLNVIVGMAYHDLLSKDPGWIEKLKSGEVKWTDPDSLKAIQKFESWVDKGYILDGSLSLDDTQAYQAFYQGKAAMLPNGTWSIDKIATAEPDFAVDAFAYVSDAGTDNKAQYCPGAIWSVAAESANTEAAGAVLNWISQPENAQIYTNAAKQFGTVSGLTTDFHPAAQKLTPIYEMEKTPMFHAYLTANAKTEVFTQFQKLIAKSETGVTVEGIAAAVQAAQDIDNAQ
jgi:raffinose/stachyose/melibiose transport system substrate-binding protein